MSLSFLNIFLILLTFNLVLSNFLLLLFGFIVIIFSFWVFSFRAGLPSLLGPPGFWHLALPVGVCGLEYNNNNNNNHSYRNMLLCAKCNCTPW